MGRWPVGMAVTLSFFQVKTHLQAQAASEIAVGHQYRHQVRGAQTCSVIPSRFFPAFCLHPVALILATALPSP